MPLPIDVIALFDEVTDIQAARETELSVSLYVDEKAPADLVAHMRSAFASTLPTVRMSLSYLDSSFAPRSADDVAIVVAGESLTNGAAAEVLRAAGVPVMVVTTMPSIVERLARESGYEIPEGDIVAPCDADESQEPFQLTDELCMALDERMGRWIVAVCLDKRLALAVAFPFMRRPLAIEAVQATSLQNAGIGLVPLLPGADLPIMTLNQAKMVLQIASAYNHDMDLNRLKELAIVVCGAYVCRTLARELTELIPVLGFVFRPGIAYAGTAAIGHAVIEYFEGGESVGGVANVATTAAETGNKAVSKLRQAVTDPKSLGLADKVGRVVPVVREKADQYGPAVRDLAAEYLPKAASAASTVVSKVASL